MNQALQGIRVIDMSHVIAGPLASMYLAQLGAEVIKIEPVDGGEVMRSGQPMGFAPLNAGKRSLAVDIRQPEGAALVRELARTADVFIENYRPGTVARLGLGWDDSAPSSRTSCTARCRAMGKRVSGPCAALTTTSFRR